MKKVTRMVGATFTNPSHETKYLAVNKPVSIAVIPRLSAMKCQAFTFSDFSGASIPFIDINVDDAKVNVKLLWTRDSIY